VFGAVPGSLGTISSGISAFPGGLGAKASDIDALHFGV